MQVAGSAYRAKPMPEGLAFGGGYGTERVWLDGDFGLLTVRHFAHDHTYQSGPLFPGQVSCKSSGMLSHVCLLSE